EAAVRSAIQRSMDEPAYPETTHQSGIAGKENTKRRPVTADPAEIRAHTTGGAVPGGRPASSGITTNASRRTLHHDEQRPGKHVHATLSRQRAQTGAGR